jgi:hypothetical protein
LKGAGDGALGALLVGGLAVGAATLGAPVAAVTVGLGALAIGGVTSVGKDRQGWIRRIRDGYRYWFSAGAVMCMDDEGRSQGDCG